MPPSQETTLLRGGVLWSADYNFQKSRKDQQGTPQEAPRSQGNGRQQSNPSTAKVTTSGWPVSTKKKSAAAVVDVSAWPADATTVMLRNIPSRYTQEDLLEELHSKGFYAAFDYFHLMIDIHSRRNKGFAFLNMRSPALARDLHSQFHGVQLSQYKSQKVLQVALAEVQGLHANAISYLNVHRDRVQNVWFKPIIFVNAPGQSPDWKAIPLSESNLPEEIARVYGTHPQRTQQRERVLTTTLQKNKVESESASHYASEDSTTADELLMDGEYEEITSQVNSFLTTCCGGANHSPEAILAALERPQRKSRSKKVGGVADQIYRGMEEIKGFAAIGQDASGCSAWQASSSNVHTIEIAKYLSEQPLCDSSWNNSSLFSQEPLQDVIPPVGFRPPPGLTPQNSSMMSQSF